MTTDRGSDSEATLADLAFRHPFRRYQQMMLDDVAAGVATPPYHLVAPPGAGKTIIGLELIRRHQRPAVVLAPTATIRDQWAGEVAMFADEATAARLASTDPDALATINCFTYQLVSVPATTGQALRERALATWRHDLVADGHVADDAAARERIDHLATHNRRAWREAVNRRVEQHKRALLREPGADIRPLLHDNAAQLIDALVDAGVTTVVLDECHHLLDYWAIVVRHLLDCVGAAGRDPVVVGLTATLPSPDGDREYDNYTTLLGDVDFEVPTPAVVKEGDLAPYRQLAYFTEPTEPEQAFLDDVQGEFERAAAELLADAGLADWVAARVHGTGGEPWPSLLHANPVFAVAALRFLARAERPWPTDPPPPATAAEPMTLADWSALIERFGLDVLRASDDDADHARFAELRRMLRGFGLSLTERGMRQTRSPGDLVLAFSASKDAATADIVRAERDTLGERLRAVVVTDFATVSSAVRRSGVLDTNAGSAHRVFRHLVADPATAALDPVLVTGQVLQVGADWAEAVVDFCNDDLARRGVDARCRSEATDHDGIVEVVGRGTGWSSATYVAMVTDAFDAGLVRCLVGTRGVFGEGWDSLALNVLVDLTSVTTSTSTQQLRGRSLRLDPNWSRKVAHDWDVICVAPDFERGDSDLRRLVRRHGHLWGVVPHRSVAQAAAASGLPPERFDRAVAQLAGADHRVVRGLAHVDPILAHQVAFTRFDRIDYDAATRRCLGEVDQREASYERWRIGEAYDNRISHVTTLRAPDLRFQTVWRLRDSVAAAVRRLRLLGVGLLALFVFVVALRAPGDMLALGITDGAALTLWAGAWTVIVVGALQAVQGRRELAATWRTLTAGQPIDAVVGDVAACVADALADAGLVDASVGADRVHVAQDDAQQLVVSLRGVSEADSAAFSAALREVLAPVDDARYLIRRDDRRLPGALTRGVWALVRRVAVRDRRQRPAWHAVPRDLAVNRDRAEAFAARWRARVGGGELVYTRSDEGARILLAARAQTAPAADGAAFATWA